MSLSSFGLQVCGRFPDVGRGRATDLPGSPETDRWEGEAVLKTLRRDAGCGRKMATKVKKKMKKWMDVMDVMDVHFFDWMYMFHHVG